MTDGPQNDLGWSPEQWAEVAPQVSQNLIEQGWTPPAGYGQNPNSLETYPGMGGSSSTETGLGTNIGTVAPADGTPLPPITTVRMDPSFRKQIRPDTVKLDPKLATKLLNIPRGTQFGPSDTEREYLKSYIKSARMRSDLRTVLSAVQQGYTQIAEIALVTGYDHDQVSNALRQLLAQGIIKSTT